MSYFSTDIPFMSEEELKANGILESRLAKVLAVEIVNDVMKTKRKDWYEKKKGGKV